MNAGEAFLLMKQGKCITRKKAGNPLEYFRIQKGLLIAWDGVSDMEVVIDGVYTEAIMAEDYIENNSIIGPLVKITS